jgi:hypothetical protein
MLQPADYANIFPVHRYRSFRTFNIEIRFETPARSFVTQLNFLTTLKIFGVSAFSARQSVIDYTLVGRDSQKKTRNLLNAGMGG